MTASSNGSDTRGAHAELAKESKFRPTDQTKLAPSPQLLGEKWMTVLESPCTFPPDVFHGVMLNLIKNPNVTSSHLFRADIFYESVDLEALAHPSNHRHDLAQYLRAESRPRPASIPGYVLQKTIVRQLIPRNPLLDRPLVQTCHFFQRLDEAEECNVVLYVPHVDQPEDMPFYHPAVAKLAFRHAWRRTSRTSFDEMAPAAGSVSVSYGFFGEAPLTPKLERTALKLLQTVHKHGQGQLAGYEKRVHLDQLIPQKRYQDTYARLKAQYGRQLSEKWVEVTDPGKHVFEDIGIAAFLIELWRDMYRLPASADSGARSDNGALSDDEHEKPAFPGFVDIGCGNGILVHILLQEGYPGWGFDARQRKTWSIFPASTREQLKQRLLVPAIFSGASRDDLWHDGVFDSGVFIISNHADELTAWTPLLAHRNDSAFIAVPCCSHDLSGARFRAPASTRAGKPAPARLPQQESAAAASGPVSDSQPQAGAQSGAATGSLKRTEVQRKMPSAYATLCSYVTSLAEDVGFEPEKEVLRIPSTRNQCIVGRRHRRNPPAPKEKDSLITEIVERELGKSLDTVGSEWIARAEKLSKKPGSGH